MKTYTVLKTLSAIQTALPYVINGCTQVVKVCNRLVDVCQRVHVWAELRRALLTDGPQKDLFKPEVKK